MPQLSCLHILKVSLVAVSLTIFEQCGRVDKYGIKYSYSFPSFFLSFIFEFVDPATVGGAWGTRGEGDFGMGFLLFLCFFFCVSVCLFILLFCFLLLFLGYQSHLPGALLTVSRFFYHVFLVLFYFVLRNGAPSPPYRRGDSSSSFCCSPFVFAAQARSRLPPLIPRVRLLTASIPSLRVLL